MSAIPSFPLKPFIDGQFVDPSGSMLRLVNPASEETVAEVHGAGEGEIEKAVQGAYRAWTGIWRDLAPGRRSEVHFRIFG